MYYDYDNICTCLYVYIYIYTHTYSCALLFILGGAGSGLHSEDLHDWESQSDKVREFKDVVFEDVVFHNDSCLATYH